MKNVVIPISKPQTVVPQPIKITQSTPSQQSGSKEKMGLGSTATPIPRHIPITNIKFSKASGDNIIVSFKNEIIHEIPYKSQYHIEVDRFSQTLMALGEERFKEFIAEEERVCKRYFK